MGGIKTDEVKVRVTTTIPEKVVEILTEMQNQAGLTSLAQIINICLDSFISYYNDNNLNPDFVQTLFKHYVIAHKRNSLLKTQIDYGKIVSNLPESYELSQSFKISEMLNKQINIQVTEHGEIIISTSPESE